MKEQNFFHFLFTACCRLHTWIYCVKGSFKKKKQVQCHCQGLLVYIPRREWDKKAQKSNAIFSQKWQFLTTKLSVDCQVCFSHKLWSWWSYGKDLDCTQVYVQSLPLISNQHDDHVRTRMLSSIFKPCCQMIECISPAITMQSLGKSLLIDFFLKQGTFFFIFSKC